MTKSNQKYHILVPLYLALLLWVVKWVEYKFGYNFAYFGIRPDSLVGLRGVLFSPFIHGDIPHLLSNTMPIILLSSVLFYFYDSIAWRVLVFSWLLSGVLTWFIGRESYHIGASGLIYALAFFLFFSGLFRKNKRLMAISLIITFLYGGLVWGVFPNETRISWEGHLSGALSGTVLAFLFRNMGLQKETYNWEFESDEELTDWDIYLEELALKAGDNYKENVVVDTERDKDVSKVSSTDIKLNHRPVKYYYIKKKF